MVRGRAGRDCAERTGDTTVRLGFEPRGYAAMRSGSVWVGPAELWHCLLEPARKAAYSVLEPALETFYHRITTLGEMAYGVYTGPCGPHADKLMPRVSSADHQDDLFSVRRDN